MLSNTEFKEITSNEENKENQDIEDLISMTPLPEPLKEEYQSLREIFNKSRIYENLLKQLGFERIVSNTTKYTYEIKSTFQYKENNLISPNLFSFENNHDTGESEDPFGVFSVTPVENRKENESSFLPLPLDIKIENNSSVPNTTINTQESIDKMKMNNNEKKETPKPVQNFGFENETQPPEDYEDCVHRLVEQIPSDLGYMLNHTK